MAIFHLSAQYISRMSKSGNLRSAVSCAAYRSGDLLKDVDGTFKMYNRKCDPESFILTPANAPAWASDRNKLWSEVEKKEKGPRAQLAREINVALPIELNDEEQRKLAEEFCQKNFADKGMVADVSIHRDHDENPHFHVMLTLREFDENGSWKNKSRKEYIRDEQGNKVLNANGNYKTRHVDLNNWNKKETLQEWRNNWAALANKYLRENGIDKTITAQSFIDQGKAELPTIHEGYVARKIENRGSVSERCEANRNINKFNIATRLIEERKKELEEAKTRIVFRCFSLAERRKIRQIAKETKTFIDKTGIEQRLKQLDKWKKSIEYNGDTINKIAMFDRIEKDKNLLRQASEILEKEATRYIEKHYPNLNQNELSGNEKIALVDATIRNEKFLGKDEIIELLKNERIKEVSNAISGILKDGVNTTFKLRNQIEEIKDEVKHIYMQYNVKVNDKSTIDRLPDQVKDRMRQLVNARKSCDESLEVIDKLYDQKIKLMYGERNTAELNMMQKELLVMSRIYYKRVIPYDDVVKGNVENLYNTSQQKYLIDMLAKKNYAEIKEKFKDFKPYSKSYVTLFCMECVKNGDLSENEKQKICRLALNKSVKFENEKENTDKQTEFINMYASKNGFLGLSGSIAITGSSNERESEFENAVAARKLNLDSKVGKKQKMQRSSQKQEFTPFDDDF